MVGFLGGVVQGVQVPLCLLAEDRAIGDQVLVETLDVVFHASPPILISSFTLPGAALIRLGAFV